MIKNIQKYAYSFLKGKYLQSVLQLQIGITTKYFSQDFADLAELGK